MKTTTLRAIVWTDKTKWHTWRITNEPRDFWEKTITTTKIWCQKQNGCEEDRLHWFSQWIRELRTNTRAWNKIRLELSHSALPYKFTISENLCHILLLHLSFVFPWLLLFVISVFWSCHCVQRFRLAKFIVILFRKTNFDKWLPPEEYRWFDKLQSASTLYVYTFVTHIFLHVNLVLWIWCKHYLLIFHSININQIVLKI